MIDEIWKDIPEYEGKYQASTLGRIKIVKRTTNGKNPYTGKPFRRIVPERILRPGKYCKSGHLSVVLHKGHGGIPVHQLVMKTFIGDPPHGAEVLHINGDPADNRLINLHYGTRTENILDVYRQGGRWRKLSIDDVETIRLLLAQGVKGSELAKMYKVTDGTINAIKYGRTFSWLL